MCGKGELLFLDLVVTSILWQGRRYFGLQASSQRKSRAKGNIPAPRTRTRITNNGYVPLNPLHSRLTGLSQDRVLKKGGVSFEVAGSCCM